MKTVTIEMILSMFILLICSTVFALEPVKYKHINIGKVTDINLINGLCKNNESLHWYYTSYIISDYTWCVMRNNKSVALSEYNN